METDQETSQHHVQLPETVWWIPLHILCELKYDGRNNDFLHLGQLNDYQTHIEVLFDALEIRKVLRAVCRLFYRIVARIHARDESVVVDRWWPGTFWLKSRTALFVVEYDMYEIKARILTEEWMNASNLTHLSVTAPLSRYNRTSENVNTAKELHNGLLLALTNNAHSLVSLAWEIRTPQSLPLIRRLPALHTLRLTVRNDLFVPEFNATYEQGTWARLHTFTLDLLCFYPFRRTFIATIHRDDFPSMKNLLILGIAVETNTIQFVTTRPTLTNIGFPSYEFEYPTVASTSFEMPTMPSLQELTAPMRFLQYFAIHPQTSLHTIATRSDRWDNLSTISSRCHFAWEIRRFLYFLEENYSVKFPALRTMILAGVTADDLLSAIHQPESSIEETLMQVYYEFKDQGIDMLTDEGIDVGLYLPPRTDL